MWTGWCHLDYWYSENSEDTEACSGEMSLKLGTKAPAGFQYGMVQG